MDDARLSFECMRALAPLTTAAHRGAVTAIVGKIHLSAATATRCAAKRNDQGGKEKRLAAYRGRTAAQCRHLGPLAARWPHLRCCLDEVSFPADIQEEEWKEGSRRERERERADAKLQELLGFCDVSRDALRSTVCSSTASRTPFRSYSWVHLRNLRSVNSHLTYSEYRCCWYLNTDIILFVFRISNIVYVDFDAAAAKFVLCDAKSNFQLESCMSHVI